jgi:hypothetical protein
LPLWPLWILIVMRWCCPIVGCGTCPPTWARRRGKSRRFSEPVTLVAALEGEHALARPGMVERHRECLAQMTGMVDEMIAVTARDDLSRPDAGLALVMFAAELASAVRADEYRGELPEGLVRSCEQAVTAATLAAGACLSGLVETMQALSALVG